MVYVGCSRSGRYMYICNKWLNVQTTYFILNTLNFYSDHFLHIYKHVFLYIIFFCMQFLCQSFSLYFCVQRDDGYIKVAETYSCDVKSVCCVVVICLHFCIILNTTGMPYVRTEVMFLWEEKCLLFISCIQVTCISVSCVVFAKPTQPYLYFWGNSFLYFFTLFEKYM
jgi:hypothetical protein